MLFFAHRTAHAQPRADCAQHRTRRLILPAMFPPFFVCSKHMLGARKQHWAYNNKNAIFALSIRFQTHRTQHTTARHMLSVHYDQRPRCMPTVCFVCPLCVSWAVVCPVLAYSWAPPPAAVVPGNVHSLIVFATSPPALVHPRTLSTYPFDAARAPIAPGSPCPCCAIDIKQCCDKNRLTVRPTLCAAR